MSENIETRKADHIRLACGEEVEAPGTSEGAFDGVELTYQAFPELDRADIDTSVEFLGKNLRLPFLIGSMTGGTPEAHKINLRLAKAASECGVGMCLGSQRVMIEKPETEFSFKIREVAPDILLLANIGAVQLNLGVGAQQISSMVRSVGADGLIFHMNAAQEAMQTEGDTQFAGVLDALRAVISQLDIPCGVKEVGAGFSSRAAQSLSGLPLAFVESAGRGGTSWTLLEGLRASDPDAQRMGRLFANWGVPSVTSLINCVNACQATPVVASGGIRDGLDIARCIALGATLSASARPMILAAMDSVEAVVREIEFMEASLRNAMFLTGSKNLSALARASVRVRDSLLPKNYEGANPR